MVVGAKKAYGQNQSRILKATSLPTRTPGRNHGPISGSPNSHLASGAGPDHLSDRPGRMWVHRIAGHIRVAHLKGKQFEFPQLIGIPERIWSGHSHLTGPGPRGMGRDSFLPR